jgi:hypothetical protein
MQQEEKQLQYEELSSGSIEGWKQKVASPERGAQRHR